MTSSPMDVPASPRSHPAPKLMLAIAIALIGDRLFYAHALGISVALFLGATAAAAWVANRRGPAGRDGAIAFILLLAGILPLIETVSLLSLASGIAGIALFCTIRTGGLARGVRATSAAAAVLVLRGSLDVLPGAVAVARWTAGKGRIPQGATVRGWVVPLALTGVFASLFASANPLIDAWISDISWSALFSSLDLPRILLWLCLLAAVAPFIAPRMRSRSAGAGLGTAPSPVDPAFEPAARWLDPATILRCLVLFNGLFALQSTLDIAYLWGGLELPPGVAHAAYAHRGAYPLVVTALLAAVFVLVALRPGGAGEASSAIRALVYLWVMQNVLLVASAMLRLDLYVAAYSLTFPRVAAFIWMALVAVGLALILARIALRRTNTWLVGANALALAATLHLCAFVNFAGLIANYNLAHSTAARRPFDLMYATSLGVEAVPAVDWALVGDAGPLKEYAVQWRTQHVAEHRSRMQDWRAWTLRGQRLSDYLEAHPDAPGASIGPAGGSSTR